MTQSESSSANGDRDLVSRRRLLKTAGAGATAFFVAHATGDFRLFHEAAAAGQLPPAPPSVRLRGSHQLFDNEPFDPDVVIAPGGWFPSIYGAGDELGALNEVTPQKTLKALKLIEDDDDRPLKTYSLGELMQEGMPAFGTRQYVQARVGGDPPRSRRRQPDRWHGRDDRHDLPDCDAGRWSASHRCQAPLLQRLHDGATDRRQPERRELPRPGERQPIHHPRVAVRRAQREGRPGCERGARRPGRRQAGPGEQLPRHRRGPRGRHGVRRHR